MLLSHTFAAAALSGVAAVGLLVAPSPIASPEPVAVTAVPGSTVTYTRAQTRAIDRAFAESTANTAAMTGGVTFLCSLVPTTLKPLCAFQGGFAIWSIAMVRDNAGEAARTNQCLKIDFAPNPRVDSMPVSWVTNGADCRD